MILANIAYVRHHNKWNGIRHNFVADPTIPTIYFNLSLISWHFQTDFQCHFGIRLGIAIEIFNDCSFAGRVRHQKNPHLVQKPVNRLISNFMRSQIHLKNLSQFEDRKEVAHKKKDIESFRLSVIPSGVDKAFNGGKVTFVALPDAKRLLMCGADEEGDLRRIFNKAVPF